MTDSTTNLSAIRQTPKFVLPWAVAMAMFHLDDVVDGEFPSSVEGPPHRRKGCSEIDQLIDSFLHFDHPLGTRLDNTDDKLENSSQGRPDQN